MSDKITVDDEEDEDVEIYLFLCGFGEDIVSEFFGEKDADEDEDEVEFDLLSSSDDEEEEDPTDEYDADFFLIAESVEE